jgi:hypothetical protein
LNYWVGFSLGAFGLAAHALNKESYFIEKEKQVVFLKTHVSQLELIEVLGWGLGWCSGSVPALSESNLGLIPGSGRDTFSGLNMLLAIYGVPAGSLCHVQQRTSEKPDSSLD